jgi:hypothetical protein
MNELVTSKKEREERERVNYLISALSLGFSQLADSFNTKMLLTVED